MLTQVGLDIMVAPDKVKTTISEKTDYPGLTRVVSEEYQSPTVQVGRKVIVTYSYVNSANSPAFGALSGTTVAEV